MLSGGSVAYRANRCWVESGSSSFHDMDLDRPTAPRKSMSTSRASDVIVKTSAGTSTLGIRATTQSER